MIKTLSVISVSVMLFACGGAGSTDVNSETNLAAPELGAALPDATDTSSLEVDQAFGFTTARSVDIEFDIAQARNDLASVTICTDYEPVGEEFDINFDSCTISGELNNGAFQHSMEVTNDKDSVVAVVLFQDAELIPLYKEFAVDSNQRANRDGSLQSVIVWK